MKQNNRKSSGRPQSAMGSESGQSQRGRGGGRFAFNLIIFIITELNPEDAVEVAAEVAAAVAVAVKEADVLIRPRPIVKVFLLF